MVQKEDMINFFKLHIAVICALFAFSAQLYADTPNAADSVPTSKKSAYRLRPLDVLNVRVFQEQDLDTVYKVNQNGTIVLPLINAVKVAGLSVQEAQKLIKELYEKDYLVNADVSIFITEYCPQRVYVIGQVNRPGEVIFPPEETMTVSKAIAGAGGTTRLANQRALNIKRLMPDGAVKVFEVDLRAILNDQNAKDFPIYEGDTIEVPEAMF